MGKLLIGCSGWSYPQKANMGGWVGPFYPNSKTKRLPYYSQYFNTVEIDATFYAKFYSKMTKSIFQSLVDATPDGFQFSVKVPELVTHARRLNVELGAMTVIEEFLDKISPLNKTNKLGAVLIQLPPSFSVDEFKQVEDFLERLPRGYQYALEFRHASWQTEGPYELLKQYNIAAVMTDSPDPTLRFLAEPIVTADHAFIRFHGRNPGFWYDYLYKKEELEPWAEKAKDLLKKTKVLRAYYNNHPMAQAVFNAIDFLEMMGETLTKEQAEAKERIITNLSAIRSQTSLGQFTA